MCFFDGSDGKESACNAGDPGSIPGLGRSLGEGIFSKFGFGVQNEAGQRLIEFCQENALVIANTLFQQHKRRLYNGHHQTINTKIRLMIFFVVKDGDTVYSQQKQTVAQIMNSLFPNSDLN